MLHFPVFKLSVHVILPFFTFAWQQKYHLADLNSYYKTSTNFVYSYDCILFSSDITLNESIDQNDDSNI